MATVEEQKQHIAAFKRVFLSRRNLPVLETQKRFPLSAPVRGPVWIVRDEFRVAGASDVRESLFDAIKSAALETIVLPPEQEIRTENVHAEWVGHRSDASRDAVSPQSLSDNEIFGLLQSDVGNDLTIVYTHGGGFYTGSSVASRWTTTKLARLTKARVLSVDYRLAPQAQFPSQVLDLLLIYLALLYPPPGSKHGPVPAMKVVLTGDSSGALLPFSLVQYILQLQRTQRSTRPTVRFGGRNVDVPMPAGIAVLSAELDKSLSLPSWTTNSHIDILQDIQPANAHTQPPDEVWPASPPRHDVYCHASTYLHAFVSPCLATDWQGAPPLWLAYGEERCIDGGRMLASHAASQGVPVQFSEYSGMPHIFAAVLPKFRQSQECMVEWAAACLAMADGRASASCAKVVSSIKVPGDTTTEMDVKSLFRISRHDAIGMIRNAAAARKVYTGKAVSRTSL